MPKFAIGDVVDQDKLHSGTVIAIFTTVEGEQRYAVGMDGYGHCNLSWSAIWCRTRRRSECDKTPAKSG
jgi:hypothetical protein